MGSSRRRVGEPPLVPLTGIGALPLSDIAAAFVEILYLSKMGRDEDVVDSAIVCVSFMWDDTMLDDGDCLYTSDIHEHSSCGEASK